jgi:geranylgeranyl diphosphate synthase, type II
MNKRMYAVEELQNLVNSEIGRRTATLEQSRPSGLYVPVSYSLGVGGKRLRPVLLLTSFNLFSDEIEKALPAALAIEVFHNFTLLHDDIMDKAEVRRNKPTVHMKYGGNTAILSGDAMAFLAYRYLTESPSGRFSEVVDLFTATALEVCEGQQFDMDFEARAEVTELEYLEMIRLKTAVLLGCSLKAGGLLADAPGDTVNMLYDLGIYLGMAFQIQDDCLDVFGTQQAFGKMIGGDIIAGKKTYLLVKALEKAGQNQKHELEDLLRNADLDPKEKINAVVDIYHQIGIKEFAEEKIKFYFNEAAAILLSLPVANERKEQLYALSNSMLGRNF